MTDDHWLKAQKNTWVEEECAVWPLTMWNMYEKYPAVTKRTPTLINHTTVRGDDDKWDLKTKTMSAEERQNHVVSKPWTICCSTKIKFRNLYFVLLNLNSPPNWNKVISWWLLLLSIISGDILVRSAQFARYRLYHDLYHHVHVQ